MVFFDWKYFFSKSLFNSYGGFDESFQSYGWEDLELGYRMSLDKVPLVYLPSAINYHYHVISKEEDIRRCVSKGQSAQRFYKKHPKLKWFLGLNPLSVMIFNRLKPDGFIKTQCEKWFELSDSTLRHRFAFGF